MLFRSLVKFKPTKSGERTSNTILSLIGGSTVEVINTKSMQSFSAKTKGQEGILLLVNSDLGTMEAIDLIKDLKEVEYAEPNWIYNHHAVSNDTYFTNSSLWGMLGSTTSPSNQFGSHRSEEHTSELQSLTCISYAVFCLKKIFF